jgi:putative peptidoglycan lipid II flippase
VNFVLSVSLAWYLTRIGFAGTHAGLALAISVAALLNAFLLYRGLRREGVVRHGRGWAALLFRTAVANIVMTAALVALQRPLSWWLESGIFDRVTWLAMAIVVAVAAYFAALFVLGMRTADFRLRQN